MTGLPTKLRGPLRTHQLIRHAQAGDQAAMDTLVQKHERLLGQVSGVSA